VTVVKIYLMRHRLTRLDEIYPGYSLYFITCCTQTRQILLTNPPFHDSFRHFCVLAQEHNVLVGRYVIMSDHLHFFARINDSAQISMWIKSLKNSLSKTLRVQGIQAPHWQKGYFDHVLRSEQSYEEKWLYVRENPVRKGLITEFSMWPYQGEVMSVPFN